VPAHADPELYSLVWEIASLVRGEQFGVDITAGWLSRPEPAAGAGSDTGAGEAGDAPAGSAPGEAASAEAAPAEAAPGLPWEGYDVRDYPLITEVLARAVEEERPVPVVVPLLVGPAGDLHAALEQAIGASGTQPVVTDVLGPHPLLSEAVHVRLSEAGLARADRARLFTINTAADGIVLATAGGEEAVQEAAAVTGVLLAARLAVPVIPAALDIPGSVAAAADHLRQSGCVQPAIAPFLVGPEVPPGTIAAAAKEAGLPAAEPLGAYPGIARLVLGSYLGAIGVEMEQPAQAAPLG